MYVLADSHATNLHSPVRRFYASVEVFDNASALVATYTHEDSLKEYSIERVGENNKFFGFGICQKLNVKLRDVLRQITLTTDNYIRVKISAVSADNLADIGAYFYVSECHRDENTNELSITAYDKVKACSAHYTSEMDLSACACYDDYNQAIISLLGLSGVSYIADSTDIFYNAGSANIEGSESLRDMLDDMAEATQSIYYINPSNYLVFRRISKDGEADLTISKDDYIDLDSGDNRRLATICHATELGDNVSASITETGTTQYIRDNMFWVMEEDVATLVDNALALYGGLTINQFNCIWRGDYRLELGDKIALVNKDNSISYSYIFSDSITYNGGFEMENGWSYEEDNETASNPSSLGDVLKQTYARVDKANKQIDIVVSDLESMVGEVDGVKEQMSSLQLTTNTINANVTQIQESNQEAIDNIYANMDELTQSVNMAITSDNIAIEVEKQLANGVNSVTTTTGFTFNEEGLTVSKSDSEMSTTITDDGMKIYLNEEAVLTANNQGVDAYNLHATTYLIVGKYSRFEDFGERTGCFWIGEAGYTATDTATLDEVAEVAVLEEIEVS